MPVITASQSKIARSPVEEGLLLAYKALVGNLIAYAERDVFTASSEKDKRIQETAESMARTQADVAGQIAAVMDELNVRTPVPSYPAEFTGYNFMSYTAALPKLLDDLSTRQAALAKARNGLLESIRQAQNAAALLTAAKIAHEKAIERLNAQAAGVCNPARIQPDPPEVALLVPRVEVVDLVQQVAAPVQAAPVPAEHGHDDHGAHGHDDHGAHAPAAPAHAAPAHAAPAAKAEPAKPAEAAPAPKAAEAAPAAKAPEPEPAAEAPKQDEEANFVATWTVGPLDKLDGAKTNFMLASETGDAGQLTKLAHDSFHLVRHNVVQNPATPASVVEGMLGDPSVHVRRAARKRLGK